jgi:hypothetical protein
MAQAQSMLLMVVDAPLDSHSMFSDETGTDKNLSTRVNAARLPEYIGRHVRLACKILKVRASSPYPVFETHCR